MAKKILMVLTSHEDLGDTGKKTGFWLEEFAAPYYVFKDAGAEITLASPNGGYPPQDPKSADADAQTVATRRFNEDQEAQRLLANTFRLSVLCDDDFDGVFYPGGHGPLWDLAEDADSAHLIAKHYSQHKPVAFVCHAPGVLKNVKGEDGEPLVKGKSVTGFSNSEEDAMQLSDVVPFMVEDMLIDSGGNYSKAGDWAVHVVRDGKLITGQNPASSADAAKTLLEQI